MLNLIIGFILGISVVLYLGLKILNYFWNKF